MEVAMLERLAFLPALLLIIILSSVAPPISRGQTGAGEFNCRNAAFVVDVPSRSQNPGRLIANLQSRGIELIGVTIDRGGTPPCTHMLLGRFGSSEAARRYGNSLVGRGIIDKFLVTAMPGCGEATKPHRTTDELLAWPAGEVAVSGVNPPGRSNPRSDKGVAVPWDLTLKPHTTEPPSRSISRHRRTMLTLAPGLDPALIPSPDPVSRALVELNARRPGTHNLQQNGFEGSSLSSLDGGLWIEGDVGAAVSRLRWIVGGRDSNVVEVDRDHRVTLNKQAVLKLSGADRIKAGADLVVADYIRSNEGIYLLTQLIGASHRYCLHIGPRLPTAGGEVPISGTINLDNNFDSRINPYRKAGFKVPVETPPAGFDSMIGINPSAVWFNIRSRRLVPDGMIAFHEMAEALAKVEYGLEYLPVGLRPGAHDVAMQRELKLSSQRAGDTSITTAGGNRVFSDEKSLLEFEAEFHESRGGR
jgi:hypothetical protein